MNELMAYVSPGTGLLKDFIAQRLLQTSDENQPLSAGADALLAEYKYFCRTKNLLIQDILDREFIDKLVLMLLNLYKVPVKIIFNDEVVKSNGNKERCEVLGIGFKNNKTGGAIFRSIQSSYTIEEKYLWGGVEKPFAMFDDNKLL